MGQRAKVLKAYFEVTNHCNFRCKFCPINSSRRRRQHMDLDLFKKGVDEIACGQITDTIGFHVLGEPLVYPHILKALYYAREHGLRTEVTTNGSLLTEERAIALVEAGLGLLTISIQILDEAEHPCQDVNLSFKHYYDRIMSAVSAISRPESNTEVAIAAMNSTTMKFLDVDKPMKLNGSGRSFEKRILPLVVDLYAATGTPFGQDAIRRELGKINLAWPRAIRLRINDRTTIHVLPFGDWGNAFTSQRVYPPPIGCCNYALNYIGVLSNGEVTICCADFDGKTSLGNLNENTLVELLRSRRADMIRQGFLRFRVRHPYCQRCLGSPNRVKAMIKGLGSIYLFKIRGHRPGHIPKEVLLTPGSH